MLLTTGSRWRGRACATEVIVVRTEGGEVDLRCGGHPMAAVGEEGEPVQLSAEFSEGSAMGKRYELEAIGLEVLVTKGGDGSLAVGTTPLVLKAAKRLPTSD